MLSLGMLIEAPAEPGVCSSCDLATALFQHFQHFFSQLCEHVGCVRLNLLVGLNVLKEIVFMAHHLGLTGSISCIRFLPSLALLPLFYLA